MSAAGNSRIEKGLCNAGAVNGLLSVILRCLEQPEEAVADQNPPKASHGHAKATQAALLEPAIVALSNLAAESPIVKESMRQAGAIEVCVELLTAKASPQSSARLCQRGAQDHTLESA